MGNTSTRKELFGFVEEILAKVGILEEANAFLNSELVKKTLSERYDNLLKRIENTHEMTREDQKAKSNEVIEKIKSKKSKDYFVNCITETFKTDLACATLKLNSLEDEETATNGFEEVRTYFKEEPEIFIKYLNDYARTRAQEIFEMYARETYTEDL